MNIVKILVENPIYMLLASNILLIIALVTKIIILKKQGRSIKQEK